MTHSAGDSSEVPSISQLVRGAIDAGMSTRQLARACDDVVAHQTFGSLANGEIRAWPKNADTVRGLAKALGVDARAVILGFAVDLGLDVREDRSMLSTLLPASVSQLKPEEARVVAQLVSMLTDGREPRSLASQDWFGDPPRRRTWAYVEGEPFDQIPEAAIEEGAYGGTPPGQSEESDT